MYIVHVPASQLLSELGIFGSTRPCATPEQTEPWCADNPISQPKRHHQAPREQIPAQNTALGQPEEELHLLTALPNRFGFPVVSLSFTTPGFWGEAEPFPCCDSASGRVQGVPKLCFCHSICSGAATAAQHFCIPSGSGCTAALGL